MRDFLKAKGARRGVRFQCAACGRCCSDESEGNIFVFREDIEAAARHLGITPDAFITTYCEVCLDAFEGNIVDTLILRMNGDGCCCFQEQGGGCRIYPARPFQCLGFPFWRMNLEDDESWAKVQGECVGISPAKGGRLYSPEEIRTFLRKEWELEEGHFHALKEHDFKIARLYPCLQKKQQDESE